MECNQRRTDYINCFQCFSTDYFCITVQGNIVLQFMQPHPTAQNCNIFLMQYDFYLRRKLAMLDRLSLGHNAVRKPSLKTGHF